MDDFDLVPISESSQTSIKRRRGRPPKSAATDQPCIAVASHEPIMQPKQHTTNQTGRIYKGEQLIDHDLFKCEVASLKRNASYNDDMPIWELVDHVHFYHSCDSRGKPLKFTNKVGGHFHEVKIVGTDAAGRPIAQCGPAVFEAVARNHGKVQKKLVQVPGDDHTHQISYRFSEKIKPQTINQEWVKVQSQLATNEVKQFSHPDISEGE